MEPLKSKKSMIWVLVLIVVIIVALSFIAQSNKKTGDDVNNYGELSKVDVEGTEDTTPVTTPVAVSTTASLTYQQALAKYKTNRIQFDPTCQAIPNNMTFKNGTTVMLDNRSAVARTININGPVALKAYGFRIVTLSSTTLPKTILVDCGTGQNVATILLQK